MYKDLVIKTKSLGGTSELTVIAPIKPGLVPSLESVTYKTRVKRLLGALNVARTLSHEYSYFRAFSDAIERVGKIHAVRITIVEPDRLMLSVVFDGGRESYMRTLWQKVGTLLDVIFCNTVGYVVAWDNRFEAWADWVRNAQIETDYLYAMPALSVDDTRYLRSDEALRLELLAPGSGEALASVRQSTPTIELQSWSTLQAAAGSPQAIKEIGRQGLRALVLLHRLTSLYLPADAHGTPLADGRILHRAARDLLNEFVRLIDDSTMDAVLEESEKRFGEQIAWLRVDPGKRPSAPQLPTSTPTPDSMDDVQGGILEPYPGITHGALVMIAFRGPAAAASFLESLISGRVLTTAGSRVDPLKAPTVNIALTCEGLRAAGLREDQIELFPQEFREGMEARASLLGDLRGNHPRRWHLPTRNWGAAAAHPAAIELSSVHAVVQLRMGGAPISEAAALDPSGPLRAPLDAICGGHDIEILSIQPLTRYFVSAESTTAKEHFGFADGDSQPVLDPAQNGAIYDRNQIQLGELLLGYPNEAEGPVDVLDPRCTDAERERSAWTKNGSFLVVRKLAQDVGAMRGVVEAAVHAIEQTDGPITDPALRTEAGEKVYAKMMGRRRDGVPLADPSTRNDFDYVDDPEGRKCPFHAHIRRANPRPLVDPALDPPGRRMPRLLRRSMSYGPPFDADPQADRGLVFMTYNTSIVEQFEVVQRWLSGGNSSGGYSGQSDPLIGVPPAGDYRHFRYEDDGQVRRIQLDGSRDPLIDPAPLVRLEWGAYLFTPSITAVGRLASAARAAAAATTPLPASMPWRVADGWDRIVALRAVECEHGEQRAADAWKETLEDPEAQRTFDSASVWAAIRARCGGVLRTPYGVIVADQARVSEVLENSAGLYSVSGYRERMVQSIGEIYLGLDDTGPGCPYRTQSSRVNGRISSLRPDDVFEAALAAARAAIDELVADEKRIAAETNAPRWELGLDMKEVIDSALAALCQQWFGLPANDPALVPGGARWDWVSGQPPSYPGHFTAPSRYLFQPRPGRSVQEYASAYGEALQRAFGDLIRRHRDGLALAPPVPVIDPGAPLAQAILAAFPERSQDDQAARTMIGVMMGFLPTVDGNLRLSMNEWLRDGSFWALRAAVAGARAGGRPMRAVATDAIRPRLIDSMLLRPSPELVWRTATRHHQIGDEAIVPGDRIAVAIVSATHQSLETGTRDVSPVFGGDRHAARAPTHACPAQAAAMEVLLGIAAAFLERSESMRAGAAPLTLALDGEAQAQAPARAEPAMNLLRACGTQAMRLAEGDVIDRAAVRVGEGHTLVVDGDSWLCYRSHGLLGQQNLACHLIDDHGFALVNLAVAQSRLQDFYGARTDLAGRVCDRPEAGGNRIDKLCSTVKNLVKRGKAPTAIVFSAAGNDVVDERLWQLLNRKGDAAGLLNEPEVARVVDGLLQCWLRKVLTRLVRDCVEADGVTAIPIFIHGYDHPVPDGRNSFYGVGNSPLLPAFENAGYAVPPDLQLCIDAMRLLIDRLNTLQAGLVAEPSFAGRVFHVNMTGTLSKAPVGYKADWDNELHPTQPGFARLAQVLVGAMVANIPALQPPP